MANDDTCSVLLKPTAETCKTVFHQKSNEIALVNDLYLEFIKLISPSIFKLNRYFFSSCFAGFSPPFGQGSEATPLTMNFENMT